MGSCDLHRTSKLGVCFGLVGQPLIVYTFLPQIMADENDIIGSASEFIKGIHFCSICDGQMVALGGFMHVNKRPKTCVLTSWLTACKFGQLSHFHLSQS